MRISILDFFDISGSSVKKFDGVKKYVATGDVVDNKIVSCENVNFDNKPSRANVKCKSGDIIFAKMKDTIKVLIIDDENKNNIYSTGFFCITPKKDCDKDFIYWLLNSKGFNRLKNKYSKGATQCALNNDGLKKIGLNSKPSLIEQEKIANKLNKIEGTLQLIEKQVEYLDNLVKSQFVKKNKLTVGGMIWYNMLNLRKF